MCWADENSTLNSQRAVKANCLPRLQSSLHSGGNSWASGAVSRGRNVPCSSALDMGVLGKALLLWVPSLHANATASPFQKLLIKKQGPALDRSKLHTSNFTATRAHRGWEGFCGKDQGAERKTQMGRGFPQVGRRLRAAEE